MKRPHLSAILAVLGALAMCGSASALQLLYPLDGTYVTKSSYLVIKGGDTPQLTGISVEINGVDSDVINISSQDYRAIFADMFIVKPLYDPGENRIIVRGFQGQERKAMVEAKIYYLDRFDQPPPAGFTREAFHLPEREEPCVDCHNMTPSAAELSNPDPGRNPCASCHMRMLKAAHVHGPAGVFECTLCHDTDSAPSKYQPNPASDALCLDCHDDKLDEFRKAPFVHGPVEAGMCLVCHDPHASEERGQLLVPAYDLCVACHARMAEEPHVTRGTSGKPHPVNGVPNPAGMGEELSCASCHEPHAGVASAMFRWGITSRMSLCAKCHKK